MGFFKKVSSNANVGGARNKRKTSIAPKTKKFSSSSKRDPGNEKGSKRKRTTDALTKVPNAKKTRKQIADDEEVVSSSEDEEVSKNNLGESEDDYEDDDQLESTADEKQLRETIKHIDKDELSDDTDADEQVENKTAPKVVYRKIALQARYFLPSASIQSWYISEFRFAVCAIDKESEGNKIIQYRPHRFSPVCLCFSSDGKSIVSCSKDGSVIKYDVESKKVSKVLKLRKSDGESQCHKGHVLCCAISPDDKFVATAGEDKIIKIWNFETFELIKEFKGHRSSITSLVFRKTRQPIELYSGSADRSIMAWNLDQMGFVDTMYGHQDGIQQMDMLSRARVLSCGGQDRTLRLFKIAEESQLVFNGFAGAVSIDTVALVNEDHFVSGSADGIYVWSIFKKKPVCVVKLAHGADHWICSVAACPNTDLVASGSNNGIIKLWKVGDDYRSLTVVDEFKLSGFINDICFTEDASTLACAVGQEHRSGRWWKIKEARNSIVVIPLV